MEWILPAIQGTFRSIKDSIKLEKFICDFAISIDKQGNKKALIIELNPWLETTDSCLFSWFRDSELVLLQKFFSPSAPKWAIQCSCKRKAAGWAERPGN